ncbi:MAG: hypothetical protein U9Q67_01695 [Patescibacteria group bacterium]|nr:hypothetical protein [Patescibacteria group bacterium]
MAKQLPKAVNLLESSELPQTAWDKVYYWIFAIGRYLIVAVEVIVLAVFVFRFVYDRRNNDLIDSINAKVELLNEQRNFEQEVRTVQMTLASISQMIEERSELSSKFDDVLDNIPAAIEIESFTINQNRVDLECFAPSYSDIEKLEKNFKSSDDYESVLVSLSRSGVDHDINFTAQITLAQESDVPER